MSKARSRLRLHEARSGLAFVAPWVFGLTVFTVFPILASFYFSFTDFNIINPPRLVGFENYERIATDPAFFKAIANTAVYTLLYVPIHLILALGIAVLLSMPKKGIGLYRTIYYLPTLAPPVEGTIVFLLLLDPRGGLINQALAVLGLPQPGWFTDPAWAKPALVILSLWGVGAATLIFLAGLKDIPPSLLEAAAVDGASAWRRFRHVTIPLLTPVILFNAVISVIYSLQVFSQAYVVSGSEGRPLESTLMYLVLIYRTAFRYFDMGYASALTVLLFVVVTVVTALLFKSTRRWIYYESDDAR